MPEKPAGLVNEPAQCFPGYIPELYKVVIVLDSTSSSVGQSPGQGFCIVFMGKVTALIVPLSAQVRPVYKIMSTSEFRAWG